MPASGATKIGGDRTVAKRRAQRQAVEIGGAAVAVRCSGTRGRRGRSVGNTSTDTGGSGSGDGTTGGSDDVSSASTSHIFSAEHGDRGNDIVSEAQSLCSAINFC